MNPLVHFRGPLARIRAVFVKELIQLRRDRVSFATMIFIPLAQLLLFGFAINTDPRHLPTAVYDRDGSPESRSLVATIAATGYFDLVATPASEDDANHLMLSNRVQFVIQVPPGFGRRVQHGEMPAVLVVADASDPVASGNAINALEGAARRALERDLVGPSADLAPQPPPFEIRVHRRYNPAGEAHLNIVPGLTGTILTLTMLIFTALSVTREIERGTMESLLAMPIRPVEIMLGKIAPYVVVGALQATLILVVAWVLFDVPMTGSLPLVVVLTLLFIVANLSVGYTFSTVATNQLQAVQMSFFFFLPSILLSGFMFPFRGMPVWAQTIGEILPLTHFLRIVRGILLKGAGFADLSFDVLALALFTFAAMAVAVARFRQTLD